MGVFNFVFYAKSPTKIANYTVKISSVKNAYVKYIDGAIQSVILSTSLNYEKIVYSIFSFDLR